MATTQKVVAVLRKAGFEISKYHASSMVRGWGDWTRGCRVKKHGDVIRVDYTDGSHGRASAAQVDEKRQQALDALRAAGLPVVETGTAYTKWLEVK